MVSAVRRKELQDKLDPKLYLCYDYILIISEDRVLATHGGSISLITFDAELLFTADLIYVPEYPSDITSFDDGEPDEAVYSYTDDVLIYVQDGRHGIINYNGAIILEANYSNIEFMSESEVRILP